MSSISPFPLWDPQLPFPECKDMRDPDIITHVTVERAVPGGWHYLHESSIALHRGSLYICWANHPLYEINLTDELIRGTFSRDGLHWQASQTWAAPKRGGSASYNHPVICDREGTLWGFFVRWEEEGKAVSWDGGHPSTEIFTLDDATGSWQSTGALIPGFLPFRPPMKMADGNWIISGEEHWFEGAVALSREDDFTSWEVVRIPRPQEIELIYPETTLMERDGALLAILRPRGRGPAPVSLSHDCGRTWSPLQLSNLLICDSMPFCGRLSDGRQYLLFNNYEAGRTLLSIAVADPGAGSFSRVWKVRHQEHPVRRLLGYAGEPPTRVLVGKRTEWSYPAAVEHDGNLYISYTHGKEDCVLSIIPLSAL